MKTQKGITLIALIITIIVMLILVGVSVTVALNGGLFSTAKQATDKTAVELDKEQLLELALGAIGDNGQVDFNKLDEAISADGKFEGTNKTYTSKKTGTTYKVNEIGSIEIQTGPKGFEDITAANYGDTIEYSAGNVDDWKVFYKEGNYLYIITSDYLPNSLIPNSTSDTTLLNMDTVGTYGAYWWETSGYRSAGVSDISQEVATIFKLDWLSKATETTGTSTHAKSIGDLLNTTAWSKFAGGIDGAMAIGAPTIEMWVASWNQKGVIEGTDNYPMLYLNCNEQGYSILDNSDFTFNDSDGWLLGGLPTDDPLYFLPKFEKTYINEIDDVCYDKCLGYYLASPSNWNWLRWIIYDGGFTDIVDYSGEDDIAVRPVVAIPASCITTNASGGLKVAQ